MSNFAKIVIIILILMSFFFIKEKYGTSIDKFISSIGDVPKVDINLPVNNEGEKVKEPVEIPTENNEKYEVDVYFLALDSDDNGIYKKVVRTSSDGDKKLDFAIKELLKGPNLIEKSTGAYSEIPQNTKLLGIKHSANKIVIDLSSDFQYGGGTDSLYSRIKQLIKTILANNTSNKPVYLYLDGQQADVVGGEGIMIKQPLMENSLDD